MSFHNKKNKIAVVTGSAGFIGFHVSKRLLDEGWHVIGMDCLTDYYDINLKRRRESILLQSQNFQSLHQRIEDEDNIESLFKSKRPNIVIHLAAQAGVRYSIEDPSSYIESNVLGTFKVLEAAKKYPPKHLLIASTSSVYGANQSLPYSEADRADYQMSFYAATKKATENFAHTYAHLYNIPTSVFRFFTVYGPWGRPDMALFKFTHSILKGRPIELYNNGMLKRDFTYISDLVEAVYQLTKVPPRNVSDDLDEFEDYSSPVAPFQIVNIGNSKPVELLDFVETLEKVLGKKAIKIMSSMQPGDVHQTWANSEVLQKLVGYQPSTELYDGISEFVSWYRDYYDLNKTK